VEGEQRHGRIMRIDGRNGIRGYRYRLRNSRNESRIVPKPALGRSGTNTGMDDRVRIDLRCRSCGYGIVVAGEPPVCPLCHAHDWEPSYSAFPQPFGTDADAARWAATHDGQVV
jgi:hypothetical protein